MQHRRPFQTTPPERCTPLTETILTPHAHRGLGPTAWREMVREIVESRELTWRLFLRDFAARYRQPVLGYAWAIVPPLLTVATFTLLNKTKVLPVQGTKLPYPAFVLRGTTVWQLFASGVTGATQSLVNAGSLITKINFPRETLILAAFGQSLFEFLVPALLVAIVFWIYQIAPAWPVSLVPLAVIPLCLFTLGLGLILSLVNGVMRDAGQFVASLLTFWMFLTPVVYPAPTVGRAGLLNVLNPVSPFVIAAQDLTSRGCLSQPENYATGCIVSVAVFLIGWRVFHLTEQRIAERV